MNLTATEIASFGALAGALATALATFALWRVTRVMAKETKRLADATAQPQVVASIIPNRWSVTHFDIELENTGNASAFDIEVAFDPPLPNASHRSENEGFPFEKVSILKPGQKLASSLADAQDLLYVSYMVELTWRTQPSATEKQSLSYILDMSDFRHVSYLGAREPMTQIASEVKNIRDDWRRIAAGSSEIAVQSYNSEDRAQKARKLRRQYGREKPFEQGWWDRTESHRLRFTETKPRKKS